MSQIYDISSYITLVKQLIILNNLIKKTINKENELYAKKLNRKININDYNALERLKNDLKYDLSILFFYAYHIHNNQYYLKNK